MQIDDNGGAVPLEISPSLFSALRAIRHPERDVTYWIDAICIDQDEKSGDKALLVPMMDRIYRSAEETVIWLGLRMTPV